METELPRSWKALIQELSPEMQDQVRDYAEYLLAHPGEPSAEAGTSGPGPKVEISLREITSETVREVCKLSETLTPPKQYMVAPNAVSIAQAYFEPQAWFRAIYADEAPVGFVMLYDDPEAPEYFLWRFMIAGQHHSKGFGRRSLEQVIDYVRHRPGATVLETSCGQGAGSPEGFYRALGFQRNGKMIGGEVGLSLSL
jgi:diamine N-acetyltransferase